MMKTQDLIATLARDGVGAGAALPPAAARKRLLGAAVIGLAAPRRWPRSSSGCGPISRRLCRRPRFC